MTEKERRKDRKKEKKKERTYTRIGFVSLIYVLVCQGSVPLVQCTQFFEIAFNSSGNILLFSTDFY